MRGALIGRQPVAETSRNRRPTDFPRYSLRPSRRLPPHDCRRCRVCGGGLLHSCPCQRVSRQGSSHGALPAPHDFLLYRYFQPPRRLSSSYCVETTTTRSSSLPWMLLPLLLILSFLPAIQIIRKPACGIEAAVGCYERMRSMRKRKKKKKKKKKNYATPHRLWRPPFSRRQE